MAKKCAVYIRNSKTRDYELTSARTTYPTGTIFVLRYRQRGRRKWETLEVRDYAQAEILAKRKEIELLVEKANIQMGVLPAVEAKPVQEPPPAPVRPQGAVPGVQAHHL